MPSLVLVPPATLVMQQSHVELRRVVCAAVPSVPLMVPIPNTKDGTLQAWGVETTVYHQTVVDPMIAEISWRLNLRMVHAAQYANQHNILITDFEAAEYFWHLRDELTSWVAQHAHDDVLVQRTPEGWRLVVADPGDKTHLMMRVGRGRDYRIKLAWTNQRREMAIVQWVTDNLRGDWIRAGVANNTITYFVRDVVEAGMMKLRWSDPLDGSQD